MAIFKPILTPPQIDMIQEMIDESITRDKREGKNKNDTSTKQQLLILHYLGLLDKIPLNTIKKSKLLAKVLNKHFQNIKEDLTYIDVLELENSKIKTLNNLQEVKKVFEEAEMDEIVQKIELEILKLESIF